MKKIIIALLIGYVGIGTYAIISTRTETASNINISESDPTALHKTQAIEWTPPTMENPFRRANAGKYYTSDVYELPVYKSVPSGTSSRSSNSLLSLAVPMGEVRVASENTYTKKRIVKLTSGLMMDAMQTNILASATQSTAGEAVYTYRNFVAISSISTSPSFAPKATNGTTTLPPPPNIVVEDNILPIGDELAILLLFVLFYVIKRRY